MLLNGSPGKWINCKKGLRQGDPLSPYLFILVADVLQQLLTSATANGALEHPITPGAPCPVLQYTDDTLIILKADADQLLALKEMLQTFSAATGLHINFEKSTFLPICVDTEYANRLASIFDCPISSFPQPYLGLPLSTAKLCTRDFLPMIAASDKYLAGWKGNLLNEMGRTTLVTSMLASALVYHMSSLLLFKGTTETLVQKQRAFLWTGESKCHGSQCKVAWDDVSLPKEKGGLGVLNLANKNKSLLKKFLFKFLCAPSAPWIDWLRSAYGWNDRFDFGDDINSLTPIWKDIYNLLPSFRKETKVLLGNGLMTAFWVDLWFGSDTLVDMFPALFSHTLRPNASVARVFSITTLQLSLRPRLTAAAAQELMELSALMASVQLNESVNDQRVLRSNNKTPTSRDHYLISFQEVPDDPFAPAIWRSYSPQKCKFFLWLLHRNRLSTRSRLLRCNVHSDGQCPFCPLEEDCFHLFIACPRSRSFWAFIGIDVTSLPASLGTDQLWTESLLLENNPRVCSTVLTCVLWNIWKCRNAKIFRHEDETNLTISRRCSEDLSLWSNRCSSPVDRLKLETWSGFFPVYM